MTSAVRQHQPSRIARNRPGGRWPATLAFALSLAWPAFGLLSPQAAVAEADAPAAEAAGDAAKPREVSFEPFDDKAFTAAQKSGAPFVLYFEADWCLPCEEMHARTLRDPAVLEAAAGVRFLRVDMTKPDRYVDLIRESFRVIGAPTCVFFGPDGREKSRRFGFIPPADFVSMIAAARGTAGSAHSVP